jgi:ABC-type sugar transport system, periplasmic component
VVSMSFSDLPAKVAVGGETGTLPDITFNLGYYPLQWGQSGFTVPLDEVLERVGRDRFVPRLLEYSSYSGSVHTLPFYAYSHIIAYRKSAFKNAGIALPQSWREMESAARALTSDGKYGFLVFNKSTEVNLFQDLLPTNDAYFVDAKGKASVANQRTAESLDVAKSFVGFSPAGSIGKSAADQRLVLLDGSAAMMATATTVAEVLGDQASDFGAFRVPINRGDREAAYGFYGWSITRDSKNPELASDFLVHFFEEANYLDLVENAPLGHLPTMQGVKLASPRINPVREFYTEGAAVVENGVLSGSHFGPNPYAGEIVSKGVYKQMLDKAVVDRQPISDVVAWGQKQVETILNA